ncbi:hypothetical protein [Massilia sp. Bi118]|uniref:hypothetical protein n=1 Tax=Massilia sp. Bi118 TaxID=2822346 RepID=UPI001E2E7951|nr:hypothetical protein [Massilia sp. Bi118]
MKIFTAGWSLQRPDHNYFKHFLRLNKNKVSIDGIVYPKKIPEDIEGIPVLGFDVAQNLVAPDDTVLDISSTPELKVELKAFFEGKGAKLLSVADFLDRLITEDQQDALRLPFAGIAASDIRKLKSAPPPSLFDQHFVDAESYEVASKLDTIFRNAEWNRMVEFDRDDTPGHVLFNVLLDLNARGLVKHLHVLDTPRVFLDAILKLRLHAPAASFTVSVSDAAFADLGGRAEFYRRSLADCLVPVDGSEASAGQAIQLAGSAETLVAAGARKPLQSAICFMPRSIMDTIAIRNAFGDRQYRVLLRQPDTTVENLLAAVLTPALFGN